MSAMLKRLTEALWDQDVIQACCSEVCPHGAAGQSGPHACRSKPLPRQCSSMSSPLSPRSPTMLWGDNELCPCPRKIVHSVKLPESPVHSVAT